MPIPIAFDKYDYLKWGDVERCPYVFGSPQAAAWLDRDDFRCLLLALDRYRLILLENEPHPRYDD